MTIPASYRFPGGNTNTLGEIVDFGYETANRAPDSLTAPSADYVSGTVYNSRSDRIRRYQDLPGAGIESTWTWDTDTRRLAKVRMVAAGGATPVLVDQELLYDSVGSVLRVEDNANAGQYLCYEYDGLGQLGLAMTGTANCSAVSYATGVDGFRHVFNYQPSGNIDKIRKGSTWTYYDYTTTGRPHLVSTLSGGMSGSFGYDSAGNTTGRTMGGVSQALTYDESNRLTRVEVGTSVVADFSYDVDGSRVSYADQTGTTWYIDDTFEWRIEGSTTTESKNYWFDGTLVAVRNAGVLTYLASDGLGSVSGTYQPGPNTTQIRRYLPFGSERTAASLPTSFGFTGQREDDTGLMFYRSRYYDPQVGRFSQPDTIVPDPATSVDLNRYTYVRNNPVNLSDPSGHCIVTGTGVEIYQGECFSGGWSVDETEAALLVDHFAARHALVELEWLPAGSSGLEIPWFEPPNAESPGAEGTRALAAYANTADWLNLDPGLESAFYRQESPIVSMINGVETAYDHRGQIATAAAFVVCLVGAPACGSMVLLGLGVRSEQTLTQNGYDNPGAWSLVVADALLTSISAGATGGAGSGVAPTVAAVQLEVIGAASSHVGINYLEGTE